MPTNVFVSYPVDELERSKAFYTALGATINPLFTNGDAVCFVWDQNIYTMVLKREFFATLTDKPVGDATTARFQIAFSRDSREDVDAVIEAGLAAGGSEHGQAHDEGFMYARDLEDPDGNVVSFNYMVPQAIEMGPEASIEAQQQAQA
jgi:uncharacterized protein